MTLQDLLYLIASIIIPALLIHDFVQYKKQHGHAPQFAKKQERIVVWALVPIALLPLIFLFVEMLSPGSAAAETGKMVLILKWIVIIAAFGWLGSRLVGLPKKKTL